VRVTPLSVAILNRSVVTVASRPLGLLVAGQQTSSPLVAMLPGLGYSEMLHPLMRQLAAWTRVTLLNLPGWRRQRATTSAPTIAGIAGATADWLRHTSGAPHILLGHSTGAQAALHTAILAPDRVEALVLIGPTVAPAARSWPRLIARYCQPLWREPPTELVAVRRSVVAGGISPVARLITSAIADRPEQLITQLSMPTMILTGKHDRVASPTWCRQLADLGGTRLRILPGGHNSCFPYAAMTDQAIREAVKDWYT
jgi:pimeloyl-ACP methyl ester carboxylesterase